MERPVLALAMMLCNVRYSWRVCCYAMCTETGYAAIQHGVLRYTVLLCNARYSHRLCCYAIWGTETGYTPKSNTRNRNFTTNCTRNA
eukprot:2593474-Rhodomonas_salina.1